MNFKMNFNYDESIDSSNKRKYFEKQKTVYRFFWIGKFAYKLWNLINTSACDLSVSDTCLMYGNYY